MDSFQPNFPMGHMNFPPPGGAPVTPTRRPEAQRLAQPSIIPGGQIYPHQRMDQMTGMYPMMPYNMMPYYQQGFMDVPYLPDAAIPTVAGKNMKQSKGVDPESAIQVRTPYHAYKFTCTYSLPCLHIDKYVLPTMLTHLHVSLRFLALLS